MQLKLGGFSTESPKTQTRYKTIALQATTETQHIIVKQSTCDS